MEIYELTKVKQVRRRTSCHPRSRLLSHILPLRGPSSSLHSTHPLLPHSDLHQCTAGERKREGGMDKRMDEVFWEKQEDVWSPTPFGNRRGNSEVSFKVFSRTYGLHVCRSAFGMKQCKRQIMDNVYQLKQFRRDIQVSCLIIESFLLLYMCIFLFNRHVWL